MARWLVVRTLNISSEVAEKLLRAHGLHEDEVRATIEGSDKWPFSWHFHPERGWRAIVKAVIRDSDCFIVLYPCDGADGETWNLGSAYPDEPEP